MAPQIYCMVRQEKIIAHMVLFDSGKCVVNWLGEHSSVVVWDSFESLKAVSGPATEFCPML